MDNFVAIVLLLVFAVTLILALLAFFRSIWPRSHFALHKWFLGRRTPVQIAEAQRLAK
jgi:hypothetical protein